MKRDIDLVVFDLDGTLADTIPDIAAGVAHVIARYGDFGDILPLVRASVGNGVYVLFERVYAALGIAADDREADVEIFKEYYAQNCAVKTRLYPGTLAALDALKEKGIALAVATMKPHKAAGEVLSALGIEGYFTTWMGQEDMLRPKPDPWCVAECARRCGTDAARTAMVGDSLMDVKSGLGAGALSVAVLGGYYDQQAMRQSGAHIILNDIADLPAALEEKMKGETEK
ncbi:MAG: HAD-IA family hydrolase [Christensenellaceae bacterium]|nr:HAD-IA family hydrolase [Christensenellaceae bacterium]